LLDPGIVRNRAKIEATINNARKCTSLIEEFGSLASYVWSFEPRRPRRSTLTTWKSLVALGTSDEAIAMSKDLKRRGWSFVGPTTVYSFMEAMGVVNDHLVKCHFQPEVEKLRTAFARP
jgi:DNA-3-methyladenine glycosylase I